jgi:hypothetical protein
MQVPTGRVVRATRRVRRKVGYGGIYLGFERSRSAARQSPIRPEKPWRLTWDIMCAVNIRISSNIRIRSVGARRGQIVKRQSHLVTIEIDLQHAIDRLADDREFVERGLEQATLDIAVDDRD